MSRRARGRRSEPAEPPKLNYDPGQAPVILNAFMRCDPEKRFDTLVLVCKVFFEGRLPMEWP